MDIRNVLGSSSFKSAFSTTNLKESSTDKSSNEEDLENEVPPSKRTYTVKLSAARPKSRKYSKKWENDFPWLQYDSNFQGAFYKDCRKAETRGQSLQGSGGVWVTKPFQIWKKEVEKMKTHASSESHLRQVEAGLVASRGETVVHQLHRVGDSEKSKTRKAIKAK